MVKSIRRFLFLPKMKLPDARRLLKKALVIQKEPWRLKNLLNIQVIPMTYGSFAALWMTKCDVFKIIRLFQQPPSIGVSEIQEQALFSYAHKNPADIVGIRFATKVTPTATFACQNVGASLLAISAISNFPFSHRPRHKHRGITSLIKSKWTKMTTRLEKKPLLMYLSFATDVAEKFSYANRSKPQLKEIPNS